MENAFDLGVEYERERLASIAEKNGSDILAMQIRGRE